MTSEAKFTPGPWATSDENGKEDLIVVGKSVVCRAPNNPNSAVNWPANARLISAAPDMYEALKPFMELARVIEDDWDDDAPVPSGITNEWLCVEDFRNAARALAKVQS